MMLLRGAREPGVRKANILLAAQALSDFGDQISFALLSLCILDISQSTSKIGLNYLIATLGFAIFTLLGGFIGDRFSRKNILFFSDIGRGATVLVIIYAIYVKSLALIYCTSFLLSMLGSLQRPSRISVWTESIPNERLENYNSWSELSIQASTIIGPLIASYFVASFMSVGFLIDAGTFFICALIFRSLVTDAVSTTRTPRAYDMIDGFRCILRHGEACRFIAYDAMQMIGFGAFNATFLVLAQRDFGWSKVEFSYHLSIFALCSIGGALLANSPLTRPFSSTTKLIACAIVSSLALWLMLAVKSFPLVSFLFGICNAASVMGVIITRTRILLVAKANFSNQLSSIIAARSIVIKIAALCGTGLCLYVADKITLETALIFFIAPIAFSFLPLFSTGIPQIKP